MMYVKTLCYLVLVVAVIVHQGCDRQVEPIVIVQNEPSVEAFVSSFVEDQNSVEGESFAKIVEAACGHQVLPIDPEYAIDAIIVEELEAVLNETIRLFNSSATAIKDKQLDSTLIRLLDRSPGFKCDYARNAKGNIQRTGYPNLRWIHGESGRVVYIDPRIIKSGSHDSSLQSFNYRPSRTLGKIHDDANHLLISLEHKNWKFSNWYIVDLYRFKVRLRIEFEASNKEVYKPEYIIRDSGK